MVVYVKAVSGGFTAAIAALVSHLRPGNEEAAAVCERILERSSAGQVVLSLTLRCIHFTRLVCTLLPESFSLAHHPWANVAVFQETP